MSWFAAMTLMQMSLRLEILQVPGIIYFRSHFWKPPLLYWSPWNKIFFFFVRRIWRCHSCHLYGCLWFKNIKHWCYWVSHFSEMILWKSELESYLTMNSYIFLYQSTNMYALGCKLQWYKRGSSFNLSVLIRIFAIL